MPISDFDIAVPNTHTGFEAGPPSSSTSTLAPEPLTATPNVVGSVNLLDWDETPNTAVINKPVHQLELQSDASSMTPPLFQQRWMEYGETFQGLLCQLLVPPSSAGEVDAALRVSNIFVMASGALPNNSGFKFFIHASDKSSGLLFLAQLVVSSSGEVSATVKNDPAGGDKTPRFLELIVSRLTAVFRSV